MGSSSAPSSDTSALIASQASAAASAQQYALGTAQLQWAQDQWNQEQPAIQAAIHQTALATKAAQPVIQASATEALKTQKQDDAFSKQQQDLYTGTYAPLEQKYAAQAQAWDSPNQEALNAGAAEANVTGAMDQQRQSAATALESFGVDPTSTRYAALDIGSRAMEGAAAAGAGTTAIQATKLQGLGLEAGAINTGRGFPAAVAGLSGAGTGAGSSASGGTSGGLSATGGAGSSISGSLAGDLTAGSNAAQGATSFTNAGTGAMNAVSGAVNGYNTSQMQGYEASQIGAAGLGSAVGGLLGNSSLFKLALGGTVPAQGIPTGGGPQGPTVGGSVPGNASPSAGQTPDDVNARLTAGEFVIPRDTVNWFGEKHFVGLVDKSRQAQAELSQRKDIGGQKAQALPTQPTFASRPLPQGIPTQRAA